MKLIVGLGNPGLEYQNTYHNLGFLALDKVAEHFGLSFNKEKCLSLIAEEKIGAQKVIFAKPQTYMNLSGNAVRELCNFYKIPLENVLVIFDDYDLPTGAVRLREEGSAGTHNGMKNIISQLKTDKFKRIRVGFHPKEDLPIPLIDLVLSKIKGESEKVLNSSLETVKCAVIDYLSGKKFNEVMQKYNKKAE